MRMNANPNKNTLTRPSPAMMATTATEDVPRAPPAPLLLAVPHTVEMAAAWASVHRSSRVQEQAERGPPVGEGAGVALAWTASAPATPAPVGGLAATRVPLHRRVSLSRDRSSTPTRRDACSSRAATAGATTKAWRVPRRLSTKVYAGEDGAGDEEEGGSEEGGAGVEDMGVRVALQAVASRVVHANTRSPPAVRKKVAPAAPASPGTASVA